MALIGVGRTDAKQIEDRRRRVDEAHDAPNARLAGKESGRSNDKRNVDVLVIEEEGVSVVAIMLPECFAVIAEHDPHRIAIQSALAEAAGERAERRVSVVKRVAIPPELVGVWKRTRSRSVVRVMAGDRKVRDKESLTSRNTVDPFQNTR